MIHSAKARAKKYDRDFNITIDDLVVPEICPVFGTPMKSPSIDRTDSSKGYVPGNVDVISHRANQIKSDATLEELRQLVAYLEARQSSASM